MEKTTDLQDHGNQREKRVGARREMRDRKLATCRQCPGCRDQQNNLLQKRKRTSMARPFKAPVPTPQVEDSVTPPSSTSDAHVHLLYNVFPRTLSPIPPAELPAFSSVASGPRASTAPLYPDCPVRIHKHSEEEYQRLYHDVVDDMLGDEKSGVLPYSVELGRRIKHQLWERLDRPSFTSSDSENGRVHVDLSYGVGLSPLLYEVDTLGEPKPEEPPTKRAKKQR